MRNSPCRLVPLIFLAAIGAIRAATPTADLESHATPLPVFEAAGIDARPVEGPVTPPKLIERRPPEYPGAAQRAGVSGKVVLKTIIDEQGYLPFVQVEKSSGRMDLDNAAIDAVKTWRYRPARLHGVPIRVLFSVVVHFDAREETKRGDPDNPLHFPPEYTIEDP